MSHNERLVQENGIQHPASYQHLPVEDSLPNPSSGSASPRESTKPLSNSASFVNLRGLKENIDNLRVRHQIQKILRYEFIRIWWSELLSCLIFIGALVAIVATVIPHMEKPLPQWRYGLTINTLIAIYAVILKGTILYVAAEGLSQLKWAWYDQPRPLKDLLTFDDASRGPWGGIFLIWRLRGRHFISCCGAFITIATLIVDPFAQQIVSTFDCYTQINSPLATIPRTNVFGGGLNNTSIYDDILMHRSLNVGIYSPGEDVSFNCLTGNCTFPSEYHTVAYCSECKDVTNELSYSELSNFQRSLTLNVGNDTGASNISVTFNGYNDIERMKIFSEENSEAIIVTKTLTNQSESCTNACSSSSAEYYDENCNKDNEHIKWGCFFSDGMGAATCSVFPCVRTYTSGVSNGLLKETISSIANEWSFTPDSTFSRQGVSSMVNIGCLNANDRKFLIDEGYQIHGKPWIGYNLSVETLTPFFDVREKFESPECLYQYTSKADDNVHSILSGSLNGSIYESYNSDMFYNGPILVQAIYNKGDLTFARLEEVWRNLSDSITTYVRQHGSENYSVPVEGFAYRAETCIRIQWLFLIYPAILVFICLIFFFSMVLKTRGTKTSRHDWKSSPLALLFHGLDREVLANSVESTTLDQKKMMENFAEKTAVRLSRVEDEWKFTKE